MKVQSIQSTPNPNAFKFVVDEVLCQGSQHLANAEEGAGNDLAKSLFAIDGVETLFFCDRFVTISMTAAADWRAVHEQATKVIEASSSPVIDGSSSEGSEQAAASGDDAELLTQINDLLDDRVRPALAGDGGGLEVLGLVGKTLQIRYQGACGSCPSSIAGTLMAIQNLLQHEVDSELSVVPA
ncbi:MAG: NifU family protein [Planctomycetota bacterium]|jgi:Fe-S cluster biogenesis protein NfuA